LAAGRENIWPGIALDGTSVYWTERPGALPSFAGSGHDRVVKVAVSGGTPTTVASEQDAPSYVRVDQTSVFWTTWSTGTGGELFTWGNASVIRALPDGSKTSRVVSLDLDPGSFPVYGPIAVDASSVYWVYEGQYFSDYVDGAILRVSLVDGRITKLATGQWRPYSIAVDGNNVYWLNRGSASQDHEDTSLLKAPLDGGAVTTIDVSPSGHADIALDAASIYWANHDGTVMKMPLQGGAPVTLASGPSGRAWIAVDSASVYWASSDEGGVRKVPLDGGLPTVLVSGQSSIESIAVDATSVYLTNSGTPGTPGNLVDGTVMKLTPK
jgi:hypothetical protein